MARSTRVLQSTSSTRRPGGSYPQSARTAQCMCTLSTHNATLTAAAVHCVCVCYRYAIGLCREISSSPSRQYLHTFIRGVALRLYRHSSNRHVPRLGYSSSAASLLLLLLTLLKQIRDAFKLAHLLNRTLILPRLKCGERSLAYPCYAWYHRSMAYFGLNTDKVSSMPTYTYPIPLFLTVLHTCIFPLYFLQVSMPEVCPLYYWLNLRELRKLPVR